MCEGKIIKKTPTTYMQTYTNVLQNNYNNNTNVGNFLMN